VSWEDFRRDLLIAIENTSITLSRTPGRLGRVLVASVYEARGLHHDHMFVLGLSEGEFPSRTLEDALYLDSERAAMQRAGLPLLTRQQQADEGSLFYEITGSARRTLTLTRPYIDERSNPWSVSPYWRAVWEVVEVTPERLPIAEAVDLADAARPAEAVLALAWSLNGTASATVLGAHNWLLGEPALSSGWLNALAGRRIELRRESPADDYDAHTGRLADAALIELVAEALGPERMWSASQFNDYGACPYRFFARRLLKLEALAEPKEGMDRLQHGSVLHELLEHTYRRIGEDGLTISAENRERALQILAEESKRLLADAPRRHGFRTGPLWEAEKATLLHQLDALITLDFSMDSPVSKRLPGQRRAFYQEIQFGVGEGRETPLVIDGAAGPLLVTGKIDRLDDIDGRAVVIDYKSGATPIKVEEMIEGRNVQMLLYLLAARQILTDKTIVGGAFWHIRNLKLEAMVLADAPELELARASLHQRILDGRQGIFASTPSKQNDQNGPRCARYCEFSQLCRLRQGTARKGSL
jgi:ATP-dependent helicase/DNAse subunit B